MKEMKGMKNGISPARVCVAINRQGIVITRHSGEGRNLLHIRAIGLTRCRPSPVDRPKRSFSDGDRDATAVTQSLVLVFFSKT